MPRKPKPPTCEDCYFHKNLLCALELNEPCATFRPNRPEGLVPPRQPVLLMRAPRWASQKPPPLGLSAASQARARLCFRADAATRPFADFARMRREMDQMLGDAWGRTRYVSRRTQRLLAQRRRLLLR